MYALAASSPFSIVCHHRILRYCTIDLPILCQQICAKEGLIQYKNIAKNSSVLSIEIVVKEFLAALADAKVQAAQEQAEKAVNLEVSR